MSRPSTYDVRVGLVIAYGISLGLSRRQIADCWLGPSRPALDRWRRDHPDFSELVELGLRARTSALDRDLLMCQLERFVPGAIAIGEQAKADFARLEPTRKRAAARKRRATKRAKR